MALSRTTFCVASQNGVMGSLQTDKLFKDKIDSHRRYCYFYRSLYHKLINYRCSIEVSMVFFSEYRFIFTCLQLNNISVSSAGVVLHPAGSQYMNRGNIYTYVNNIGFLLLVVGTVVHASCIYMHIPYIYLHAIPPFHGLLTFLILRNCIHTHRYLF